MEKIKLSDHFGYRKLIRFTFPSIVMMLFTSIYGIVDGYFVSNFVGKTEFAALNMAYPFVMMLGAVGFMIGSGGTALVSKTLGENDKPRANRCFSMLVYATAVIGILLTFIGLLLQRPVASLLGAEGNMLEDAVVYSTILMIALPTFMLQCAFQPLMIAAEKPHLGLWMTVAAGLTNMVLDALFVGAFGWGLRGAAFATAASQLVGCVWPLIYFAFPNSSELRLGAASADLKAFGKVCLNGTSEFVTNVALSLVNMIYNAVLLSMAGENGVSAYGVIMYINMIFLAVFFGYTMGVSPIISYHYGAGNEGELRILRVRSVHLQAAASVVMTAAAVLLARPLARLFVGYDETLMELTRHAFLLYATSYLLSYLNIFASAFFTALNDGVTSGVISFSRMLVFQVGAIILLPKAIGLDGIWLAMTAAEICSLCLSSFYFIKYQKRYGY